MVNTLVNTISMPAEDARELACGGDFSHLGWTVVYNEQTDSSRWESIHEIVFRDHQGCFWMSSYTQGLTENQDIGPWEDEDIAEFWRVVPVTQTVITYERA